MAFLSKVFGAPEESRDPLYGEILTHLAETDGEASAREELFRRFDNLYYPQTVTQGGPDHWATHPTAKTAGKVHVSINTPPVYVDSPADIQSIRPYINAVPRSGKEEDLVAANMRETLFWLFWNGNDMDLQLRIGARIRALYGEVALRAYWDAEDEMPEVEIVQSPENLRIGWGASDFSRKDWAIYRYFLTPQAIREDFSLEVTKEKGKIIVFAPQDTPQTRIPTEYERTQVACYDYWYKKTVNAEPGKPAKISVRNAFYVGNYQVFDVEHPEFDDVPYIYIPNGTIPGQPHGKSELHDLEQLFHEKDEAFSRLGQIMARATEGQMFQINGPDAPSDTPPAAAIPAPNKLAAPGPGNVINPVTPYLPAFQGEQYLKRLDEEMTRISGLSDLLMGMAGGAANSSKAVNAQLGMYVPRIALKREMLYRGFIHELWEVCGTIWSRKDSKVAKILDEDFSLTVRAPEISQRDDLEAMQRAITGVQNRVISLDTAMDWVGIDNPTDEKKKIMTEQTNAALNPAPVMTQMQLLQMAQQFGFASTQQAAQQAPQNVTADALAGVVAQRQQNPKPPGSQSANTPVGAPVPPDNAQAPNGAPLTSQTMLQGGKTTGRVLSQQQIGG
jgi:hypothetical protein